MAIPTPLVLNWTDEFRSGRESANDSRQGRPITVTKQETTDKITNMIYGDR